MKLLENTKIKTAKYKNGENVPQAIMYHFGHTNHDNQLYFYYSGVSTLFLHDYDQHL